ncbi:MAG: Flp pilus assembly protein CpaB [Acidimicrobiia bacterium]
MLRRPPRAIALRVGAVVVVVATAALVASDLAALHRRANDFGSPRDAVIARHDLPIGATVEARDVTTRRVYTSQLPPGVLRDVDHAIGRVVTVPVLRAGFVVPRSLASRRRTGLDGAIPAGLRALRIVVSDAVEPRVGAAVDVIASFEDDPFDAGSESLVGSATVIAHGVLVLGTDAATSSDGGPARAVTLLVSPREARDLVHAATHGFVTISLVPPEDAR